MEDPAETRAKDEDDVSLVTLFRRLAEQAQSLVRQEVALAKAEIRETVRDLAIAAGIMAAGAMLVLVSLIVFLVFLVIALGELLGGRFWLSSLIIGLLFAITGLALLMRGKNRLAAESLLPEQAFQSVQETARWATGEARRLNPKDGSEHALPAPDA